MMCHGGSGRWRNRLTRRPAGLEVSVRDRGTVGADVRIRGELDFGNAHLVARALQCLGDGLGRTRRPLTIDLSGLTFCDGAGVAVLAEAEQRQRSAGGSVVLVDPPRILVRLLCLARVYDELDIRWPAAG
jgi:anti-anti-sigma factor